VSHPPSSPGLAGEVRDATSIDVARCYQCGKCSAGCPMGAEMTLGPQAMLRLVQLDRRDRLFDDPSLWLCLTCETCTARCPNGVDTARVIDGLRELALRDADAEIPPRLRAFHAAFLDQVRSYGRVFELGLVMSYKLRTGALLDDAALGPAMLRRGKLKLVPHRIAGADEVARIFAACARDGAARAAGEKEEAK
jgi:heterodisulfide reductase subunit C